MTLSGINQKLAAHPGLAGLAAVPLLAILTLAVLVGTEKAASAGNVEHQSLVPETPRRDIPIVLDGDVWKSVQFNDRIIVAGDFTHCLLYTSPSPRDS